MAANRQPFLLVFTLTSHNTALPVDRSWVILLDALNTAYRDQGYARGQMLKFVQEQYMPGQRMAILTLTGSLNVLQDFTSDPQTLYTALQHYKPVPQTFTSAATPPASGGGTNAESLLGRSEATILINNALAAIQGFSQVQAAYAEDQRAILTLNALNSLARILGGLPGRKNVIWVTGNAPFPLIPEDRVMSAAELAEGLPSLNTRRAYEHAAGNYAATFREAHANEIRGTAARLASAQVALYPVDARGLSISLSIDSQETMRELARETGGRAYVNQNEIKGGVERAFSDILATYSLGYYPQNKKYDGKYRQIRIKVKRDGAEVQSRNGYYELDPSQAKDYNPNQEVATAARDVIPATQVSFSARIQPSDANPSAAGKVGVDFLVDANTLSVEDTSGGKRLNVDFFALVFSAEGRMIANRNIKVDKTFAPSTYQQILQHGLPLHMDLDPQPGKNQLRLAVRDNQSGMVGTVIAPMS